MDHPVGVFDSGLGGLTVVAALRRVLPGEQLVYLGDTARVPYGTKSGRTVERYALQNADFLVAQRIKYLVVACNTASAFALPALLSHLPIPVMGVVGPGAELAAETTRCGKVGVIGTLGTVRSGAYQRALQRERPELTVFSQACPLLVPLAEEGWTDHRVTAEVVRHYLLALQAQCAELDTLVLGCTHYPLLRSVIAAQAEEVFGRPVALVDSAEAVATRVLRDLAERRLQACERPPNDQFFFTDVNRFSEIARRFLGGASLSAELADIGSPEIELDPRDERA